MESMAVQLANRSSLCTFEVMPLHRIVVRNCAWRGKNRRLRAFPLTHFLQALAQQTHGVEPPYEIALTSSGTAVNRSASRP